MANYTDVSEELREWVQEYINKTLLADTMKYNLVANDKMKIKKGQLPVKLSFIPKISQNTPKVGVDVTFVFKETLFELLDEDAKRMVMKRLLSKINVDEQHNVSKRSENFTEDLDTIMAMGDESAPYKGFQLVNENIEYIETLNQQLKQQEEEEKQLAKKAKKNS